MSRRIAFSVSVVFALAAGAMTADAADLSTQSRLGAIFAEPRSDSSGYIASSEQPQRPNDTPIQVSSVSPMPLDHGFGAQLLGALW